MSIVTQESTQTRSAEMFSKTDSASVVNGANTNGNGRTHLSEDDFYRLDRPADWQLQWKRILRGRPYERDLPTIGWNITFDEFLELVDEDSRAEWVEGKIEVSSPSARPQVRLQGFLYRALTEYVEAKELGEILFEFTMKLPQMPPRRRSRARVPDVMFVTNENLLKVNQKETFLDGPADLAIEVVSPDRLVRDYVKKFQEYETAGVREYWILNADTRETLFLQLQPQSDNNQSLEGDGADPAQNVVLRYEEFKQDENGIYRSAVLEGLEINVDWLWLPQKQAVAEARAAWNL